MQSPPSPAEPDARIAQLIRSAVSLWRYEDMVFQPNQKKIDTAFRQYNNRYTADDARDEGQSCKVAPTVFMTVERLAAALVRPIDQSPGWFQSKSVVPQWQVFLNLNREYLSFWLNHHLVDFESVAEEAAKMGAITGHMHVMVTMERNGVAIMKSSDLPEETQDPENAFQDFNPFSSLGSYAPSGMKDAPFVTNPNLPRLKFTVLPTSFVRLDSSGANRYKMWRTYVGIGEFLKTARERGYDMDACLRAIGKRGEFFDQNQFRRYNQQALVRNQESPHNVIELLHFEGDCHDPVSGEGPLTDKEYFVIASDCELVLRPVKMPFWDQMSVMVSAPFVKAPGAVYGKSPITEAIDVFDLRHETDNMMYDYLGKILNTPIQIDQDVLFGGAFREDEPLYPNQKIRISGKGNPNIHAVKPVQWPDLPPGFWQYLQYIQNQQAENTGMSNELSGLPRPRGRMSVQELKGKQQDGGTLMNNIEAGIERRLLTPLLTVAYQRLLQFTPLPVWRTWIKAMSKALLPETEQIPPQMRQQWLQQLDLVAEWSPEERFKKLGSFYTWEIKLYNNAEDRQAEIEAATYYLNVLSKFPQGLQVVNLPYILEKITTAFGWDPERALKKEVVPLPRTDLDLDATPEGVLNGQQGQGEDLVAPDLSRGMMSGLDSGFDNFQQGPAFPGGPRSAAPNLPKEPY